MRRLLLVSLLSLAMAVGGVGFGASSGSAETVDEDPGGASKNVDVVATIPDTEQVTALNFLRYGKGRRARDVMVANGQFGLKTYDVTDPANPVPLGELGNDALRLPGDPPDAQRQFWQNEDMEVDQRRKLVFMARDPRAYDGTTSDPAAVAGLYIVDASDPADLRLVDFHELPTGHTSTCVHGCRYLWTGGPASNTEQQDEWPLGRPIFVTDVRDPENPVTSPIAVDTDRADGVTAYAHDVDVDAAGIVWVSGLGGVRGYHVRGVHRDPVTGRARRATPTEPVPYAGGGFEESVAPTGFMHNSFRPVRRTLRDGPRPGRGGYRPGELLFATEEAFGGGGVCDGEGVFAIASLRGSYGGQAWRSTPEDPFRLETVGTWSPAEQEGTILNTFCSAHYFEVRDRLVAYSWYGQGTRFLDVSDPTAPVQVAYHRPEGSVSWAPYFRRGHVFIADYGRGVEIVTVSAEAGRGRRPVHAPPMSTRARAAVELLGAQFGPDPQLGWACPLPRPAAGPIRGRPGAAG